MRVLWITVLGYSSGRTAIVLRPDEEYPYENESRVKDGHEERLVCNPYEAIQAVKKFKPDVVKMGDAYKRKPGEEADAYETYTCEEFLDKDTLRDEGMRESLVERAMFVPPEDVL